MDATPLGRRRFARRQTRDLLATLESRGVCVEGRVRDLSAIGFGVQLRNLLPTGSEAACRIWLENTTQQAAAVCRVLWTQPDGRAGLRTLALDPAAHQQLVEWFASGDIFVPEGSPDSTAVEQSNPIAQASGSSSPVAAAEIVEEIIPEKPRRPRPWQIVLASVLFLAALLGGYWLRSLLESPPLAINMAQHETSQGAVRPSHPEAADSVTPLNPLKKRAQAEGAHASTSEKLATRMASWLNSSFSHTAQQSDPHAQVALGDLYRDGAGVAQDYAEALHWYQAAAAQGNPTGQANLGDMYRQGQGVPQDYAEAHKWYVLSAAAGYAPAQTALGDLLRDGKGTAQNYAEAFKLYAAAAAQGNLAAQNNLGDLYAQGKGTTQNFSEAAHWYRAAAERGYDTAENNLGDMYRDGKGVDRDAAEAARWYGMAAAQGYASAEVNLADLYRDGKGVAQNDSEALRWYQAAAIQGNPTARVEARSLQRRLRMTPTQSKVQ